VGGVEGSFKIGSSLQSPKKKEKKKNTTQKKEKNRKLFHKGSKHRSRGDGLWRRDAPYCEGALIMEDAVTQKMMDDCGVRLPMRKDAS